MEFCAIDVETANPSMGSVCQIGIVHVREGQVHAEFESLVNPDAPFHGSHRSIHNIGPKKVVDAPFFCDLESELLGFVDNRVVVCHTLFDQRALKGSCERYGLDIFPWVWLDSAKVAQLAWPDLPKFGLADACEQIGHEFSHHDALEDAKASAQVVIAASQVTGLDIAGLLKKTAKLKRPARRNGEGAAAPKKSASGYWPKNVSKDANPEGPLFGEVIVFTGYLELSRTEAADRAAELGCKVAPNVTQKTTLLCVGDRDERFGATKSNKQKRAEALLAQGHPIRIISESDFLKLMES